MTETTDWSGFDTAAHHAAQAGCHHLIHCAVDAATRAAVGRNLDNARSTGDANAIHILIAQLTGPCCLPSVNPREPDTAPTSREHAEHLTGRDDTSTPAPAPHVPQAQQHDD
jgi:hypothetical protein